MNLSSRLVTLRDPRLLRFLVVGGLNFLFGYSCLAVLLALNFSNHTALLGATVLGVLFNFKATSALVFKSRTNALLFRFVAVYCIVYAVNLSLVSALIWMGSSRYLAFGLLALPMALLAFYLQRAFVFRHHPANVE